MVLATGQVDAVSQPTRSAHFLVTGGAGFLGINLVRHLLQQGHRVTSVNTARLDYADVRDQVRIVEAAIRNRVAVDQAMADVDVVVHGAAALPLYSQADIFSTAIEGTRHVLDAAIKHGVERVIHISSTAVYGTTFKTPKAEDAQQHPVGPYGEAKVKAEDLCQAYRQKGLCVPILRPKTFIGPERLGVFALLYKWVKDGRALPVIGTGNNRYQLLYVDDLCDAVNLCATLNAVRVNDSFNIGAKQFGTVREDLQALLDYAGFGKRVRPLPAAPIVLALRVLERLRLSPLYQWVYETAATDSIVLIDKAEHILGFRPRFSNQEALIRNYQWYLDHLSEHEHATGVSHRVCWKGGILGLAKYFF